MTCMEHVVLSFAPHGVRLVGAGGGVFWITDAASEAATWAVSRGGEIVRRVDVALEFAFEHAGRWLGVASARATPPSPAAVVDLARGERLLELEGDAAKRVGKDGLLAWRSFPREGEVACRRVVHDLRTGASASFDTPLREHAIASNDDTIFLAETQSSTLVGVGIADGVERFRTTIAPARFDAPLGRLAVSPSGAVLAAVRTAEDAFVLASFDPATGAPTREIPFAPGEVPFTIAIVGGEALVLTDASLLRVDERAGALVPLVREGARGVRVATDGRAWAVAHRDIPGILFAPEVGSPPLHLVPARTSTSMDLASGDLVLDDLAQLVVLRVASLADGEVRARVVRVALRPLAFAPADVIDNPGTLLRVRDAARGLVELRTGALGLARGDVVRVGWIDDRRPGALEIARGGATARLVSIEGRFTSLPDEVVAGSCARFEEPRAPEAPRELELLRALGIVSNEPLRPGVLAALAADAQELRADGRAREIVAAVLREVAVYGPGAGPNAAVLSYAYDEIEELAADLDAALPERVRFELTTDGGAAELVATVDGAREATRIDDYGAPGALARAVTTALARAGLARALVDVETGDDTLMFLLVSPRLVDALVGEGVLGVHVPR